MCGRFRLSQAERFAAINGLEFADGMPSDEFSEVRLGWKPVPRYNIAPTQTVAVVSGDSPSTVARARWGLIPYWAKDSRIGSSLINARCETVATKPAFRDAFKRRHCLIPADGFYEWKKDGATKIPHHILMQDGEPFAFAGLWESWRDPAQPDAEPLRTCTIITGPPNPLVATIHDRMPMILPREQYAAWLSADTPAIDRAAMLVPFPAGTMRAYPISVRVNSPRNDDAGLLDEVAPPTSLPVRPPGARGETAQGTLFGV